MLRKVVSIKNIGRFEKYGASGDVELKRYNMIFAENGRGKTTMCAILRSLQSGDAAHVVGRTTLGQNDPPEIEILTASGMITFRQGAWSSTVPQLAIFDSIFVSENVHSGDVVDVEHRRSLYRVIVGKQGVDLAKEIEALDGKSRAKASEIGQKTVTVTRFASAGMSADEFLGLEDQPTVVEEIESKERELDAVKQTAQIRIRAALSSLILPVVPQQALESLLNKSIDNVAADSEQRVREHIESHGMRSRGQTWISEGLGYVQGDNTCPFCNQSLENVSGLVSAYRDFFSQSYNALRNEITQLRSQIETRLSDRAVAELERIVDQNVASVDFWARFCEIVSPSLERSEIGDLLRALRQAILSLLERKSAAPLERISPDPAFDEAEAGLMRLQEVIAQYNHSVNAANAIITAKKRTTAGADVRTVEVALAKLRATRNRYEPDAKKACDELVLAKLEKDAIEEKKAAVRKQLNEYTEQVIGRYEQTINNLLDDFNAGFRITGTRHGYPGGVASSSYQILINNTPVDLGDATTPQDRPSFRNTLSAGDKSTLALAFFLAQLRHDPDRVNKIVIFDDPFNSQDAFRRDRTVQKIKKCGEDCAQVVIFSHDPLFLHRIWERLQTQTADRKCLTFLRVGKSNTTIREWDIVEATQANYRADLKVLVEYNIHNAGSPRDVVQKIRPVLENYAKYVGGTSFTEADTLGDILSKIRQTGTSHQLFKHYDELEDLNEYTKRYHHGDGQRPALEPINDTELQGYVKAVLEFTGGC
jgi:wobble nucleotide-excising tRNase